MENPASRPAACDLIGEILNEYDDIHAKYPDLCGASREMSVYQGLIRAGYLIEGFDPPTHCPCPYDCDGCHDGDGVCWRGNPELWEEVENGIGDINGN